MQYETNSNASKNSSNFRDLWYSKSNNNTSRVKYTKLSKQRKNLETLYYWAYHEFINTEKTMIIYTDGSALSNPGPVGTGWSLKPKDQKTH